MRLAAARYAIQAMERRGPVIVWIIDDTGFLKQGKCSVGVQRQYTGSAGKTANCQVAVSLTVATARHHVPIDFELFLPDSWTGDPVKRRKARIPDEIPFRTKHDIALGMMERAVRDGIPGRVVLADTFYGHSRAFRDAVDLLGFEYGMGVYATDRMWTVDKDGRLDGPARCAKEIALGFGEKAFRSCTWREGTNRKLTSRFALRPVAVPCEKGIEPRLEWLLMEGPQGEKEPTKFTLTTLPRRMSMKEIVRLVKERCRTEKAYEELKGELGLDPFEGRSCPGWHHHVSVVLCCYAFLVAERARAFPPSASRHSPTRTLRSAA